MAADQAHSARLRRRRVHRRRLAVVGSGVIVLVATGAGAIAANIGGGPRLRVVTVTRASITQPVEVSGTVASSAKAAPALPVSGTVRSVPVRVGERVHKGRVLAQLYTTELQAEVDSAQSTVASARQRLEADKSGQSSILQMASTTSTSGLGADSATATLLTAHVTSSPTPSAAPSPAASPSPPSGSGGGQPGDLNRLVKQITAAQHAVISAQEAVDSQQQTVDTTQQKVGADLTQNSQLRDAQKTACTTNPDGSTGPDSDACASARADYENFADILDSEGNTLDAAISAQDADISDLDDAIATLDGLLQRLPAAAAAAGSSGPGSPSGSSGAPSSGPGSPSGGSGPPSSGSGVPGGGSGVPSSGSGFPSGDSGSTSPPSGTGSDTTDSTGDSNTGQPASAAQLAADQAQIDAARAKLRQSRQSLAAATLRSPISGRIAAIGFTPGASSSGNTITVVGTGVQKVTTSVPFAQIDLVKLGQPAIVSVDGQKRPLHGKVSSIGILSSTSGGNTTFPVVVQLAANSTKAFDGAGVDVRIKTGTASKVVAVPNSALHAGPGNSHTVTVERDGHTSTVTVRLGVSGSAMTEVTNGLKVGERVVLADYSQSVPASTNTTTGGGGFLRLLNGGGGFPVGGAFPAFPGGS